jgi:hypothetical protein
MRQAAGGRCGSTYAGMPQEFGETTEEAGGTVQQDTSSG